MILNERDQRGAQARWPSRRETSAGSAIDIPGTTRSGVTYHVQLTGLALSTGPHDCRKEAPCPPGM